ncbi:hypothetical protein ABPG72_012023 [Tetrahymena utriculariae]
MSSNINLYDTDCSTWSTNGKLLQVDYATKAIDQGSITIGLRSQKFAVLVAQKRSNSKLSGYQEKIFQVDDKIGMGVAGITADARVICKYMRTECLNHKYVYGSQHPVQRLVIKISEKSQHKTQTYGKRPYGVGTLIIAQEQDGPKLFQTLPSGDFYEFYGQSIGSRSQAAKTYLENNLELFKDCNDLNTLILHGLSALKKANQGEEELLPQSVDIAFVGLESNFTILSEDRVLSYLQQLDTFAPANQMEVEN